MAHHTVHRAFHKSRHIRRLAHHRTQANIHQNRHRRPTHPLRPNIRLPTRHIHPHRRPIRRRHQIIRRRHQNKY